MKRWWPWFVVVAVPRVVAFFFTENIHGDSAVRTWLGAAWAKAPHVIGSFDQGAVQFGPLHIYVLGLASLLPMPLADSGRLVSLVAGVLTTWPLLELTAQLFGDRATKFTALAFAFWGLHIQFSTTASGEALNLLLVFTACCWLQRWLVWRERVWLLASALMMNLACATRYDSWLLVPLMAAAVWWYARSLRPALLFGVASVAFCAAWAFGNWVDRGAPLYPFSYIDAFHRTWYPSEAAMWGPWYRWATLAFWPGTAVMTLTPLVAVAAAVGGVRAWRQTPSSRWLIVLIVLPVAMYGVRSFFLASFVPLARFTAKEVAFLLPFVQPGFVAIAERLRWARVREAVTALTLAMLVAWPVWLGWFTYRTDGAWQNTLRAIAPVTTNAPQLTKVARWLSARAGGGAGLVVAVDPRGYDDIQLTFASGFAFERVARARAPSFEQRLHDNDVRYLVLFDGGALASTNQFVNRTLRGRWRFHEVGGFDPPFHVFELAAD